MSSWRLFCLGLDLWPLAFICYMTNWRKRLAGSQKSASLAHLNILPAIITPWSAKWAGLVIGPDTGSLTLDLKGVCVPRQAEFLQQDISNLRALPGCGTCAVRANSKHSLSIFLSEALDIIGVELETVLSLLAKIKTVEMPYQFVWVGLNCKCSG